MERKPDTLHCVAKMLGAGGWSPELSSVCRRWWRKNRMTVKSQARLAHSKKAFSDMVQSKLDERDRIVLGHFIGLIARQHFDAGLTVGLVTRIQEASAPRHDAPAPGGQP